jgi:type II secretory ATPase GspE/PulE/Tfp pilus assembly ATPase PilB-like protein
MSSAPQNIKKKPVGTILVQQGIITNEILEKALEKQKELRKRNKSVQLGQILVKSGLCTEAQIEAVLKKQPRTKAATFKLRADVEEIYGEISKVTRNPATGESFVEPEFEGVVLVGETEGRTPIIVTAAENEVPVNFVVGLKTATRQAYKSIMPPGATIPVIKVSEDLFTIYSSAGITSSEGEKSGNQADTEAEKEFRDLLRHAYEAKAVDLHFFRSTQVCRVRLRVWGSLRTYEEWVPKKADDVLSSAFAGFGKGAKYSHWKPNIRQRVRIKIQYDNFTTLDCRYEHAPGDDGAYHACIRILANDKREVTKQIDLRSLGFTSAQNDVLKSAGSAASGLVILSGPTGSGKSTTLAGLVKYLNRDDDTNILTVESPIERELPAFQTSVSDDDDADPREFAQAVKSTLRRDPDILLVGELRDEMSASAAATGVQTGHTLLTTVHAQSAIEIIERLSSPAMKLPPETIGSPSFLSALVFQMLLPTMDSESKIRLTDQNIGDYLSDTQRERLAKLVPDLTEDSLYVRGESAEFPEGVSGMTICAEVVIPDEIMRKMFRALDLTEALHHWRKKGEKSERGFPLDKRVTGLTAAAHGIGKMKQGLIDPRDLENYFGHLDLLVNEL